MCDDYDDLPHARAFDYGEATMADLWTVAGLICLAMAWGIWLGGKWERAKTSAGHNGETSPGRLIPPQGGSAAIRLPKGGTGLCSIKPRR